LLAPLALLAGRGLLRLERGPAQALHAFGIVLFFCLMGLLWVFWAGAHLGAPEPFASRAERLLPGYHGEWSVWQVAIAAAASVAAGIAVAGLRRSALRPLLAWCTGASVAWLLVIVLGGSWLEARLSHQALVRSLAAHWPATGCVAAATGLRAPLVAAVRVHSAHEVVRGERAAACPWVLAGLPRGVQLPATTEIAWQGRWNGDRHTVYWLYRRH